MQRFSNEPKVYDVGGVNQAVSREIIPQSAASPSFRKATRFLIRAAAEKDLMSHGPRNY